MHFCLGQLNIIDKYRKNKDKQYKYFYDQIIIMYNPQLLRLKPRDHGKADWKNRAASLPGASCFRICIVDCRVYGETFIINETQRIAVNPTTNVFVFRIPNLLQRVFDTIVKPKGKFSQARAISQPGPQVSLGKLWPLL